jgi:hypothetical protein
LKSFTAFIKCKSRCSTALNLTRIYFRSTLCARCTCLQRGKYICSSLRSEYYGGNDGLKLLSQFFKRLQYISVSSDGMPGPQISKQMLQCGTCSGPKTIGLTYEKLDIWPVLIDKTSNYSIPKVGVQLPRTGSHLPDAGSGQEFFMKNWQGGCCWEKL